MQAVVTCLLATGLLPRAPTIPPDGKQEGLSCAVFDIRNTDGTTAESNLAPTIAQVVTRKGKQRFHQEQCQPQHVRHHLHGLERGYQGTREHRNTCSPLKRPRRQQRWLLAMVNIKVRTQLKYNGSQICSANRRNSWRGRGRIPACWEGFETWTTEEPEGSM